MSREGFPEPTTETMPPLDGVDPAAAEMPLADGSQMADAGVAPSAAEVPQDAAPAGPTLRERVGDGLRNAWNSEMGQRGRKVAVELGKAALVGALEGSGAFRSTDDGLKPNKVRANLLVAKALVNPIGTLKSVALGAGQGAKGALKTAGRQQAGQVYDEFKQRNA